MIINAHTHKLSNASINMLNMYPEEMTKTEESPYLISCGIHPWFIGNYNIDETISLIDTLCNKKIVSAIGECGLDKYKPDFNLQKDVFLKQIILSEKHKMPMIIHSVKAYSELIQVRLKTNSKQPWMVHGYTGSKEMAEQLIKKNIFISFGKYIVDHPKKAKDILNHIDKNYILLETDDADISINTIYTTVAEYLNYKKEDLELLIENNFKRIF